MSLSVGCVADVPCFNCLVANKYRISSHRCNPNHCEELDEWLKALEPEKHG